jgi:hypothetical protein
MAAIGMEQLVVDSESRSQSRSALSDKSQKKQQDSEAYPVAGCLSLITSYG